MRRNHWIGILLGGLACLALAVAIRTPEAKAQKRQDDTAWEYKVTALSYNPGESMNEAKRAAVYERLLNEHARDGWEPIGSLLSRDTVQTVGGGVTTRDTVSFVAYRRPRR